MVLFSQTAGQTQNSRERYPYGRAPTSDDIEEIFDVSEVDDALAGHEKPAWAAAAAGETLTGRKRWSSRRSVLALAAAVVGSFLLASSFLRSGFATEESAQMRKGPFSGVFSSIPFASDVPEKQRRVTLVGMWNGDYCPTYLRHFFYTVQLNADAVDLVFINRKFNASDECIDFAKHKIDITWGGNVKHVCMDYHDWQTRYSNFVCSKEYGWDCDAAQKQAVFKEFGITRRRDQNNYNWRFFRGWVFRDLLPDNQYWAWVDHDVFLGRFTHFPFNLLSQMSMVSVHKYSLDKAYITGQLTAFNFHDDAIAKSWKMTPQLRHVDLFLNGTMPEETEERLWSWAYLSTEKDMPGSQLNYALLPDLQGDDWYDDKTEGKYVISGRDVLQVDSSLSREQIEGLLALERSRPIDQTGGFGWSRGDDGSEALLARPNLSRDTALAIASSRKNSAGFPFSGILESVQYTKGAKCDGDWISPEYRLCIPIHPLSWGSSILRASFIHLRQQAPGFVFRRLEKDQRPRGYERKLLKHNQLAKKYKWLEFPDFDITEELVYVSTNHKAEVFRMGADRDKLLFYRDANSTRSIG